MTPFDEDDLVDLLQSGIAERQSGVSAPDGIGERARRAARKRTATRAVGAGVPVLAAASVATVLAMSSGSGPPATTGLSVGGSDGSALSAPTGPVKVEDIAYIVKRVKANVADRQNGTVIHADNYARGDVASDGSLVNLGTTITDQYEYTAADGTTYMRTGSYQLDGSPYLTYTNVLVPDGNGDGKNVDTRTLINPATRTYSQDDFSGVSDAGAGMPTPNLYSSPSDVQQALASGQVTQKGMATVNGARAIVLSIKLPGAANEDLTLYVDAQTYQPLRTLITLTGISDLLVADWMPATPDNIAQAEDDSIPAGYTKVDKIS
jgi:hypothetical protein